MTTTETPEIGAQCARQWHPHQLPRGRQGGGRHPDRGAVHGSGPGVTSYANWRLVIPALAEHFHVVAPDMVGFGYSDRPEGIQYSLDTWADQTVGLMDALGIEKTHLVGNSFGGGDRAADRHQAPRPGRQAGADGQHGRALPDHRGPRPRVGLRRHAGGHAQGDGLLRLLPACWSTTSWPKVRYAGHPTRLPGVVLVDVPGAPPALGRGDERCRRTRSGRCRTRC